MSTRFPMAALKFVARVVGLSLAITACSALSKYASQPDGALAPVASEEIYLELHALDGTLTPPQQLSQPVRLSNGPDQSLVAPAPIRVSGSVELAGSGVGGVSISLSQHGGIPYRPLPSLTVHTETDGKFALLVPQGSYTVVAYPPAASSTALPPQYLSPDNSNVFSDIQVDNLLGSLAYKLWDYRSLPLLTGVLQLADGTAAVGVQVSALEASATAVSVNRHLLTTPVLTETGGAFTMIMPPRKTPAALNKLHFASGTPTGIPFPTFDSEEQFLDTEETTGAIKVNLATVTITGQVKDRNHTIVPNARVTLIAQPSFLGVAAPFDFQTTVTADEKGIYNATVYTPGNGDMVNYSLVGQPPTQNGTLGLCRPQNSAGLLVSPADNVLGVAMGDMPTQDLVCDRLLTYQASVHGSSETLTNVAGTRVTATLAATVDFPIGLSVQTVADSRGAFSLNLTPGDYTLAFAPTESSGQPFTLYSRSITEATLPPAGSTITFALLPPFELTGRLYLGDPQHPLAAQMDAYLVHGSTAIKIASGLSGADGRYSLILPGSQTQQ